jgi:hypothetical protein
VLRNRSSSRTSRCCSTARPRGCIVNSVEATLLILLAIIIAGPGIAERLGMPRLIGLIFLGMLVGPFVLGWIPLDGLVSDLGDIGLLYLMSLRGCRSTSGRSWRTVPTPSLLPASFRMRAPIPSGELPRRFARSRSWFLPDRIDSPSTDICAEESPSCG